MFGERSVSQHSRTWPRFIADLGTHGTKPCQNGCLDALKYGLVRRRKPRGRSRFQTSANTCTARKSGFSPRPKQPGAPNASRRMPHVHCKFIQRSSRPGTTCRHWEVRRMTSGDSKYHSGRPKKEYASPSMEFLAKLTTNARRIPQIYEFDPLHANGIRHADLDAGVSVLNEVIHECDLPP